MVRKFIAFAGMDPADKDDAERLRAAVVGHETDAKRRASRHEFRIKILVGVLGWAMSGVSLIGILSYLVGKKWPTLFQ